MKSLKAQEVFAVGKWNGMTFQLHDLEAMVKAFDLLKAVHKVPLKIGHTEDQTPVGAQHALGWVSRLYIAGNKLMADFENVPEIVAKAMMAKLYRTVSIELSIEVNYKGQHYPFVVDGVALLGADLPAVNTLKDLEAFMARDAAQFSVGRRASFAAVVGDKKETEMDKDIQAAIEKGVAEASAKIEAAVTAKFAQKQTETQTALDAANARVAAFEKKEHDAKVGTARARVVAVFEGLVKGEVIKAAQRESFSKLLGVDDDARVVNIDVEALIKSFGVVETKSADGKIAFKADSAGDKTGDEDKPMTYESACQELDKRASAIVAKDKVAYSAAKQQVLASDEKLATVYAAGPKKED